MLGEGLDYRLEDKLGLVWEVLSVMATMWAVVLES